MKNFNYPVPAIGFGVRIDLIAQVLNRRRPPERELFYLLFAAREDLSEALIWRSQRQERLVLAISDRREDVAAEAERLGAKGVMIFENGDVHWQEV